MADGSETDMAQTAFSFLFVIALMYFPLRYGIKLRRAGINDSVVHPPITDETKVVKITVKVDVKDYRRLNYTDYSGSMDFVQDLTRVTLGIKGSYEIGHHISIYSKLATTLTDLKIKYITSLKGSSIDEDIWKFSALGVAVELGIQWSNPFIAWYWQ